MNKKGITLITVVVIIIVIIIIATTSIIAGNKLIINARNLADSQKEETVREALQRRNAEINMQGSLVPKGDSYPGSVDPLIGDGTYRAPGWYSLDEVELNSLGVKDVSGRFLVNYDYVVALDMTKNDYLDRYFACEFMYKVYTEVKLDTTGTKEYIGIKLSNKTSEDDTTNKMYVDMSDDMEYDYFGNGWYVVSKSEIANKLQDDYPGVRLIDVMNHNFLINYQDKKFEMMTSNFREL